ncbi:MAG: SUMF1/EgtB/PvdO family nonheme iron enzyme [Thermodesulfobacteriota bacterium]
MKSLKVLIFLCFYLIILFSVSAAETKGSFHALLIGIDNYQDSQIQGNTTASADSEGLAEILSNKFGFNTVVLTDSKATKKAVLDQIKSYREKLSPEDILFVYFSGTSEVESLYGYGWWLPYDAFYGDTISYIDYVNISETAKDIKASMFVATNSSLPPGYDSSDADLSNSPAPKNGAKLLLHTKKGEPVKYSEDSKYSVLGFALISALKKSDKKEVSLYSAASEAVEICNKNGVGSVFKIPGFSKIKNGDILLVNKRLETEEKQVQAENNEEKKKAEQVKEAFISVKSDPDNSKILINNELKGTSPLENIKLKPGKYTLKAEKEGFKSKSINIDIKDKETRDIDIALEKLPPEKGSLVVNIKPENADIEFKNFNGKYSDNIKLDPGVYELEIKKPFYHTKTVRAEIKEGRKTDLKENLKPLMSYKNSLSQEFKRISKGEFMMGTPGDELRRGEDEILHKEEIKKDFYIMTKEVSVAQWKEFIEASGYKPESVSDGGAYAWIGYKWDKSWKYSWESPGFDQTEDHPVTCITYNDALEFVKWLSNKEGLNYALPSEVQWEYSCRAGTDTPFAYGECVLDTQANFAANSKRLDCPEGRYREKTTATGSLEPNNWGIYDTHGNVFEWCSDWYKPYDAEENSNSGKDGKVIRGGGWDTGINNLRSGNRFSEDPDTAKNNIGFRLVLKP